MEKNVTYNFKKKMQSGEKVFGPLIGPGNDPDKTVKALKQFGYDFIILDNEHVLINEETVYSYIRAATETGIPVVTFGPGDAYWAHRIDERVELEALSAYCRTLALFLTKWCELAHGQ